MFLSQNESVGFSAIEQNELEQVNGGCPGGADCPNPLGTLIIITRAVTNSK